MPQKSYEGPVDAIMKKLFEDWELPDMWPPEVAMIVQAAVDGDAAACFFASESVEQEFLAALAGESASAGFKLSIS